MTMQRLSKKNTVYTYSSIGNVKNVLNLICSFGEFKAEHRVICKKVPYLKIEFYLLCSMKEIGLPKEFKKSQ
jgi:hypothetical protein